MPTSFFLHRCPKYNDKYDLPQSQKKIPVFLEDKTFVGNTDGYDLVFWKNDLYCLNKIVLDEKYLETNLPDDGMHIFECIGGAAVASTRAVYLTSIVVRPIPSNVFPDSTKPFHFKIGRFPVYEDPQRMVHFT